MRRWWVAMQHQSHGAAHRGSSSWLVSTDFSTLELRMQRGPHRTTRLVASKRFDLETRGLRASLSAVVACSCESSA